MFKNYIFVNYLTMKGKILLFLFILILLVLGYVRSSATLANALFLEDNSGVKVYAYSDLGQKDVIECGELKIIKSDAGFINSLHSSEFLGQCVELKEFDITNFIKKNSIEIISKEKVEDIEIYNCYCSMLPKFVFVENKRVNLQIAKTKELIKVGYPLILEGY